jgi:hypothetical protein
VSPLFYYSLGGFNMFFNKKIFFILTFLSFGTVLAKKSTDRITNIFNIDIEQTLLDSVDRTVTLFGRAHLLTTIQNPDSMKNLLVERQKAIKEINNNEKLFNQLDFFLKHAKEGQDVFADLYGEQTSSTYTPLEELSAIKTVLGAINQCHLLLEEHPIIVAGLENREDLNILGTDFVDLLLDRSINKVQWLALITPWSFPEYTSMKEAKASFLPALKAFGEVDALLSAVKFLRELSQPPKKPNFPR